MRDPFDRERLADASHGKKCAHHKGRNHWTSWQRRLMADAKRFTRKVDEGKRNAERRRHVAKVRLYWAGLGDHP